MNPLFKSLLFLLVISLTGLQSLSQIRLGALDIDNESLLSGSVARVVENEFDNVLPIKKLGINLWALIEYAIFNSGEKGVVIGNDGWLFSSEEIFNPEDANENVETNLQTILSIKEELFARGVTLVVVPVPSKFRVHGQDSKTKASPIHQTLYPTLVDFLANNDVQHVDTLSAFNNADGKLFFKTDTHWLPEAASIAASSLREFAIADELESKFSKITLSEDELTGDLTNFLPLGPWFESFKPEREIISNWEVAATESEIGLFDDVPLPSVALVGTSYSANPQWNFDSSIKLVLNEDVLNFAKEGEGPISPMLNFMDEYLNEIPQLRLVVWEIPERYLVQPYASRQKPAFTNLAATQDFNGR